MRITENPINMNGLSRITELTGGHKGVVFKLENAQEILVVKFQNESPLEALAGTHILVHAGARTPGVRKATPTEVGTISQAVSGLKGGYAEVCKAYDEAKAKFIYVLLMDFAEGRTLKVVRESAPREFVDILLDAQFQFELGKILAGDTFAGNPDRMFGKLYQGNVVGWYHEQNLKIGSDKKPRAFDNAFAPGTTKKLESAESLPWGGHMAGTGHQWGSVAAAYKDYIEKEAGALFDVFLSTTLKDHHKDADLKKYIEDTVRPQKLQFEAQVALGAAHSMQLLLARGQGWKAKITGFATDPSTGAVNQEILDDFRMRKRLLRQVAAGQLEPPESTESEDDDVVPVRPERMVFARAHDTHDYRKWVLTKEFKMGDGEAELLLAKGVQAYKNHKATMRS